MVARSRPPLSMRARAGRVCTSPACCRCTHTTTHDSGAMHGDVTTSTATRTQHVSITLHARSRAPPPMHARTACVCTSPACWRCTHTTTHNSGAMHGDVTTQAHSDTHPARLHHRPRTRSRAPLPMHARTACVCTSPACWRCTHTTTHDSHTTHGDVTAPHRAAPTLHPPPPCTHVHALRCPRTHAQHECARRQHAAAARTPLHDSHTTYRDVTTLRHVGTYPALSTALHARSRSLLSTRAPTACVCTSPACCRCTHTTT
jgi:hypothetical protein